MSRRIEIIVVAGGRRFTIRRPRHAKVNRIIEDALECLRGAMGLANAQLSREWDITDNAGNELMWWHTLAKADVENGEVLILTPHPGLGA